MPPTKIIDAAGQAVAADSPNRMIWFSAHCGYWTDNWAALKTIGPGIPCCPVCSCVGLITKAADWERDLELYERGHPGYTAVVRELKATCLKLMGSMAGVWKARCLLRGHNAPN